MDYAAALRTTPAGPAVRLDTTPVAKAQPQKAPVSKPLKVDVDEPVHVAEEESVLSVAVPSAPAKPPTNAGLSPAVRFVITVPSSASAHKESQATPAESNAEASDSSSETEEDASGEVAANGSKSNKNEPKAHNFSAQDLDNNFAHLSDLVALLEKNAEERSFELSGGFKFSKGAKNGGKSGATVLHDLELPTVTLSLKWLSALIELLRSKTSITIAAGGGAFVSIVRVEGQIRVMRLSSGGAAGKEVWLQFEDVVLEVREQAKLYLQVANRIEQVLERRESQLADKLRKDAAQRRRAISNKLHTAAFTSMLDTLNGLLAGSTEFPALSKRFHDQEAQVAQQRRRVKEENQDMMNIFLSIVPSNLLEANLKHIAAQLEPSEPVAAESSVEGSAASGDAAAASSSSVEKKDKKLSKKEQAAAAAAEAERKKAAEVEAEAARKDAEKARREKQEKLAALQAEQKKKQLVANPFAHLDGFSETAAAQLETDAELAKAKQISKSSEAKVKQQQQQQADKQRAEADAKLAQAARNAKTAAAAQEALKRQATDDAKRSSVKEAEDKKRAAAKEAEDKKRAAAERQASEKAAADKRKQEKADKVAAEKAAAAARKQQASSPAASPSEAVAKKDKTSGPDRSEKQRKAEKIEHQQKEKQRAKEMRQLGLAKKTDNTMLYAGIAGGAVVALLILFVLYNKLATGAISY